MKYLCSLAFILVLSVNPSFAQFYQYTDKNGVTIITDSPPSGAEMREKKVDEGRVFRSTRSAKDHPACEKKDASVRAPGREDQQKKDYSRVNVVMYMTDW